MRRKAIPHLIASSLIKCLIDRAVLIYEETPGWNGLTVSCYYRRNSDRHELRIVMNLIEF